MKLLEYQGKELFAQVDLPVPPGKVANTPEAAKRIAGELGFPVVVKAQVATGGRGKAGGIQIARTSEEAEKHATDILRMTIQGEHVRCLLITQAVEIEQEYYLGITLDRSARRPVLLFSREGGVDIEEVAKSSPEKIQKCHISPLEGLHAHQVRRLLFEAQVPQSQMGALTDVTQKLYRAFVEYHAHLVEINPLAFTPEGGIWALDSKFILDDDDLPTKIPNGYEERIDPLEQAAHEADLQYVKLDGSIGIIGNGAGLVMATLDLVKLKGGRPANFLDVGGGATAAQMSKALLLVLRDRQVRGVFINIFGGITRCDLVAQGIIETQKALGMRVPMVVRLVGTNEAEGRALLKQTQGFIAVSDMEEGAAEIARLVGSSQERN
ncbi:MAG: succinate--CoA ligase subunit beta [Candidatus Fraserbacteria bacterium RBG_16_55_9]|uniref:Succinate--CoA ligase [ADP-forming] subunit beta n=1 Tax=Fraserbacteria sp. (strain RBG_16_55_9) TaxID=1817864 RepID=A0A1F5UNJ6_FRAXR|nr:MAG: succinate--CoA ligase subunit beta [Candidatus Fraserbacteria bacterium RBG_16_55_9]